MKVNSMHTKEPIQIHPATPDRWPELEAFFGFVEVGRASETQPIMRCENP
jgi:hypothetical protein